MSARARSASRRRRTHSLVRTVKSTRVQKALVSPRTSVCASENMSKAHSRPSVVQPVQEREGPEAVRVVQRVEHEGFGGARVCCAHTRVPEEARDGCEDAHVLALPGFTQALPGAGFAAHERACKKKREGAQLPTSTSCAVIAAGSAYATAAELNAREGAAHVLVLRNFQGAPGAGFAAHERACKKKHEMDAKMLTCSHCRVYKSMKGAGFAAHERACKKKREGAQLPTSTSCAVIAAGSAYATAAELNAREGAAHVLALRNFQRRARRWLRRARACVQEEARKRSVANVDFFTVIAAGSAYATAAELNAREGADHVLVLRNFHRRAGSWLRRARACVQEEARRRSVANVDVFAVIAAGSAYATAAELNAREGADHVLVLRNFHRRAGSWLRRARACVQEEARKRSVANVDSLPSSPPAPRTQPPPSSTPAKEPITCSHCGTFKGAPGAGFAAHERACKKKRDMDAKMLTCSLCRVYKSMKGAGFAAHERACKKKRESAQLPTSTSLPSSPPAPRTQPPPSSTPAKEPITCSYCGTFTGAPGAGFAAHERACKKKRESAQLPTSTLYRHRRRRRSPRWLNLTLIRWLTQMCVQLCCRSKAPLKAVPISLLRCLQLSVQRIQCHQKRSSQRWRRIRFSRNACCTSSRRRSAFKTSPSRNSERLFEKAWLK